LKIIDLILFNFELIMLRPFITCARWFSNIINQYAAIIASTSKHIVIERVNRKAINWLFMQEVINRISPATEAQSSKKRQQTSYFSVVPSNESSVDYGVKQTSGNLLSEV
jgi:hypothetical protein